MAFLNGTSFLLFSCLTASAAALPQGFTQKEVGKGLDSPAGIAIAPDGRVFVGEQEGTIRVLRNDSLLSQPLLTLKADAYGQRGLMALAVDPDFPASPWLYVYYSVPSPASHNRLSRFPVSGDKADSSKEEILFELPEIGAAVWHMGGGIAFGPDGKLYCGIGDHQKPAEAQNAASPFGKILRLNRDGSIPGDGPLYASATGLARAIWAQGLRNPYTLAFKPPVAAPDAGGILANDVGESSFEEIDDIVSAGNFGWPSDEGKASGPKYRDPLYAYSHNDGCAIMGGEYYRPLRPSFPADYLGKYFFADFCSGTVRIFDPASASASPSVKAIVFSDQASFPTGLRISPDGAVYVISRGYDTGPGAGEIKRGLSKVFKFYYGSGIAVRDPGPEAGRKDSPRFAVSGPGASYQSFRIRVELASPGPVRLEIRDVQGNLQATLADLPLLRGPLDLDWAPGVLPPGASPPGSRPPKGPLFAVLKSESGVQARLLPILGR